MGAVFMAEHASTGGRYAIKTMLPGATLDDLLRFRREGELLARLDHPNLVAVHAADLQAASPWLALDLLSGGSLQDRLKMGPLEPAAAAALVETLCGAVQHAHERGVLHRDLKPSNVVFDDGGQPRIVDLGLGRMVEGDAERLTRTGEMLGTPAYMAPEQIMGARDLDARVDVYGLGGILFAALTGEAPHSGASTMGVLQVALEQEVPPPSSRCEGIPAELDQVCRRALAKRAEDRYPSAAAMRDALRESHSRGPEPVRRVALLAVGGGLAVLAAALGWGLWPSTPEPAPAPEVRVDVEPPPAEVLLAGWRLSEGQRMRWVFEMKEDFEPPGMLPPSVIDLRLVLDVEVREVGPHATEFDARVVSLVTSYSVRTEERLEIKEYDAADVDGTMHPFLDASARLKATRSELSLSWEGDPCQESDQRWSELLRRTGATLFGGSDGVAAVYLGACMLPDRLSSYLSLAMVDVPAGKADGETWRADGDYPMPGRASDRVGLRSLYELRGQEVSWSAQETSVIAGLGKGYQISDIEILIELPERAPELVHSGHAVFADGLQRECTVTQEQVVRLEGDSRAGRGTSTWRLTVE
jgi:Protein kinase domain